MQGTHKPRGLTVVGGYGGVNAGDEMILRALVVQARRAGYEGRINVVCGHSPPRQARRADYDELGLTPVSWRNVPAAARAAAGRDLFIGGGQIIDGLAGAQYALVELGLAAISRATGGRVTIGGVSTARLEAASVRRAYDGLFRCAHRIVPRDEASAADIVAITPSAAAKTEMLADLVFSLPDALGGGPPAATRRTIAFAVHHAPSLRLTALDSARALLERVHRLAGEDKEIAILAHDSRAEWDLGFARDLAAALALPRVSVRTFATTAECIAFYRTARTVISARMHPIIIGACAGAFCVPLAGSRKVADIAGRLGTPQRDAGELAALDDEALRQALGLGPAGPLPDPDRLAGLVAAAGRIVRA